MRHPPSPAKITNSWYSGSSARRGGQWKMEYTCLDCGRTTRQLRNFLGQRRMVCNGTQWSKVEKEDLPCAM